MSARVLPIMTQLPHPKTRLAVQQMIACEACDVLHQRLPLCPHERAYCVCCGAVLYSNTKRLSTLLALVITTGIVFVIANSFPIIKIELQGISSESTLLGTVITLFQIKKGFVGLLVLLTTFIVPVCDLLILLYLLCYAVIGQQKPPHLRAVLSLLNKIRIWGMVEVFLIGVLVSVVKLAGMVTVIPGVALWAFFVLSVLFIYLYTYTVHELWHQLDD